MDKKELILLHKIADEFGSIAGKVNEASKRRKTHSEKALKLIDLSNKIGTQLNEGIKSVAKADIRQRNQNDIIFNTCRILNANIKKQKELLNKLKATKSVNQKIVRQILSKVNALSRFINEALSNVREIIEKDNEIILMDNLLIMRKKYQHDSLRTLKKIAMISLKDAESAIKGSSSNLSRGLKMVKRFKGVEKFVKGGKLNELNNLAEEAKMGWKIAADVNKSSSAQLEFAEKVNRFTGQLHNDSISIRDMAVSKHHFFEENLQTVTVLTVILNLKFMKYLDIQELIDTIQDRDKIHDLMNNLNAYVSIACKDIKEVAALNYDMTDSSNLNNKLESDTVTLTKKEIEYYNDIKDEVQAMTEATRYPIEGSGKNIKNGQKLEKQLKGIINKMKS